MKKKSLIPIALLVTLLGGAEVYADGKNVITNFQLPIVHEMSTLSKAMLGKAEMGTWGGATWALADDGELIFVGGDVGTPPKNLHDTLIDNGIDISSVKSIEFTTKTQMSNVPNAFRDMASVTTIKKLGNLQYSGTGYFMFAMGTNNLTSLDLTGFDTSNFTDFNYMFSGDSGLTELDVSKFDTSKVIDLTGTFEAVTSVENLDVSNWDTSNVIRMNWTFSGMESVKKLDVSHWNTSKVYNMSMLFESCHSLTELDVSNWDMSAVDHMDYLFADMKNLRSLDLSNFKLFPNAVTGAMLAGDTSLSQLKLGPNFPLTSDMDLPNIPVSGDYTGYWQNVGSGTVDAPMGTNIWTSVELMTNYDGSQPDTYVWQKGSKMSLGQPSNYTTDLPLSTYVPTAVTPLKPYRYNVILNNDYPYYSSLIDGQMDSEHVTTPNFPVGHTVYNRATMPVIYTSGDKQGQTINFVEISDNGQDWYWVDEHALNLDLISIYPAINNEGHALSGDVFLGSTLNYGNSGMNVNSQMIKNAYNANGQIIYQSQAQLSDFISEPDPQAALNTFNSNLDQAAQDWNDAVGQTLFIKSDSTSQPINYKISVNPSGNGSASGIGGSAIDEKWVQYGEIGTNNVLHAVIRHEMGHILGLAHTKNAQYEGMPDGYSFSEDSDVMNAVLIHTSSGFAETQTTISNNDVQTIKLILANHNFLNPTL